YTLLSFFFHNTATTEIFTLSLHDALPISYYATLELMTQSIRCRWFLVNPVNLVLLSTHPLSQIIHWIIVGQNPRNFTFFIFSILDRKSTRLNSSHLVISYAVFCLKKKT